MRGGSIGRCGEFGGMEERDRWIKMGEEVVDGKYYSS